MNTAEKPFPSVRYLEGDWNI